MGYYGKEWREYNIVENEVIIFSDYNLEKKGDFLYPMLAGITYPDKNYYIRTKESDPFFSCRYVMEYVVQGAGYIVCDGIRQRVEAGDFYFLNKKKVLCYFADEAQPFLKKWINISGKFMEGLCSIYGLVESVMVFRANVSHEMDQIHSILKEYDFSLNSKSSFYLMHGLLSLFEAIRDTEKKSVTQMTTDNIEMIKGYIVSNLRNERLNPDYLCSYFYVSRRTLDRLFQKSEGIGPARYIMNQKLEYARCLLTETNMTVGEISDVLNFSSSNHFRTSFVAYYGVSPTQCRKMDQTNE